MSACALGDVAVCEKLVADEVEIKEVRQRFGSAVTTAGALPTSGVYFVAPPANPTAYTLGAGVNPGDVLKIIHQGGGNQADVTATPGAVLHGTSTSISLPGGSSVELVWSGAEWYITGRDSNVAATGAAVAGLPTIA